MIVSFGRPVQVTSLDRVSFVARLQAQVCWQVTGGRDGSHATVSDMLAELDVRWFALCDERGAPVADYWQLPGTAVIFRAASTDVVGEVVARGFASVSDRALWTAMVESRDAPGIVALAELEPEAMTPKLGYLARWDGDDGPETAVGEPCADEELMPETLKEVA